MRPNLLALLFGTAFGFVLAWARVTDPAVIGRMLLLQEADVFLLMGTAIAVAAIGVRLLRRSGARAMVTGEPVAWTMLSPSRRHVAGSAIFGLGWSLAGTCPGPMAAMIGEGRLGGLFVAAGVIAGIALQERTAANRSTDSVQRDGSQEPSSACV